ncbi:uncharacterized protein [Physcomitrium patens]|uniref:uncharacterized protein n=1 Tax=Physcomitrium patens TaxID=3218 RepID=UPI003CCD3B1C
MVVVSVKPDIRKIDSYLRTSFSLMPRDSEFYQYSTWFGKAMLTNSSARFWSQSCTVLLMNRVLSFCTEFSLCERERASSILRSLPLDGKSFHQPDFDLDRIRAGRQCRSLVNVGNSRVVCSFRRRAGKLWKMTTGACFMSILVGSESKSKSKSQSQSARARDSEREREIS